MGLSSIQNQSKELHYFPVVNWPAVQCIIWSDKKAAALLQVLAVVARNNVNCVENKYFYLSTF